MFDPRPPTAKNTIDGGRCLKLFSVRFDFRDPLIRVLAKPLTQLGFDQNVNDHFRITQAELQKNVRFNEIARRQTPTRPEFDIL